MNKKRGIILVVFLILLVIPLVSAANYGAGKYGFGLFGQGETGDTGGVSSKVSSGGSGVGGTVTQSIQFDIKILDFESPIRLGEPFDFTYFVKGVGDINNDVIINFWIEKDGETITSGSDVIFMGSNEEKTEAANLFLPFGVESGIYQFNIKVSFGSISAESHRTIEIVVEGNIAKINQLFDISFSLEEILIGSSDKLVSIITIENFAEEPATMELNFIILNKDGEEVYRGREIIIVETKEISRKSFKDLNLEVGRYTLVLETFYNSRISDEFRQDFEIRQPFIFLSPKEGIIIGLIIIIGVLVIIIRKLRKNIKSKKKKKRGKKTSRQGKKSYTKREFIKGILGEVLKEKKKQNLKK